MILVIKILFGLWGPWLFWFLVTNWLDLNQLTSTYFSIYLCKIKLIAESCLWLCSHWHGMQEEQYCYIPWTLVIEYSMICFRLLESYFSKHFTESVIPFPACLLQSIVDWPWFHADIFWTWTWTSRFKGHPKCTQCTLYFFFPAFFMGIESSIQDKAASFFLCHYFLFIYYFI